MGQLREATETCLEGVGGQGAALLGVWQQHPRAVTAVSESWDQGLDQGDKPHLKPFRSPSTKLSPKSGFRAACS